MSWMLDFESSICIVMGIVHVQFTFFYSSIAQGRVHAPVASAAAVVTAVHSMNVLQHFVFGYASATDKFHSNHIKAQKRGVHVK